MTYIDWFNHRRLDSQIATGPSYVTPAEHEANYYHQTQTAEQAVTH
jgi:hypothetical protein